MTEIIVIESEAFYRLVDEVVKRINDVKEREEDRWITTKEAMKLLGVCKTTLYNLRRKGKINATRIGGRRLKYDKRSLLNYMEDNVE